jgi:hypothetical protein
MQRRHYELVAACFRRTRPRSEDSWQEKEMWKDLRNSFIETFLLDNPQFDQEKFVQATES